MKLGIDLDGCAYEFAPPFMKWLRLSGWFEIRNLPDPGSDFVPQKYDFYEDWGMTGTEFVHACAEGVDAGIIFSEGEPYGNCVEALTNLRKDGHTIHIITHRSFGERAVHNTMDWLRKYSVPFDSITFAEDKTIVGVDLLIDDFEGNWRASLEQGIPCVIMDRPWNAHLRDALRMYDWDDFVEYVDWIESLPAFKERVNTFFKTEVDIDIGWK